MDERGPFSAPIGMNPARQEISARKPWDEVRPPGPRFPPRLPPLPRKGQSGFFDHEKQNPKFFKNSGARPRRRNGKIFPISPTLEVSAE